MAKYIIFYLTVIVSLFGSSCSKYLRSNLLPIVTRAEWGAKPPTEIVKLQTPVPNVVIHHSYIPAACYNKPDCCKAMRSMQHMHQEINEWADIGYNFAVGSDGLAYEGRGWNRLGAHAQGFNTQSIGIVLIGNWVSAVPPAIQLSTAKQLIAQGISLGWISPKYSLVGHKQASDTECPGDALFAEISSWKHFNGSTFIHNVEQR